MLAVQTIFTTWTKSSRGGELAQMRSRIPKRLPLRLPNDFTSLVWHSIRYSERNQFDEPVKVDVATHCDDNRFGCKNTEVELQTDAATLTYRYQSGAPERQFFDKAGNRVAPEHVITILRNRWASIETNGRFVCIDTGNWWYEHSVINVAFGDSLSPNIFVATPPIEHYQQLAQLR